MTSSRSGGGEISTATGGSDAKRGSLARKDWLLIPLIVLFTVVILGGSVESVARHVFTESKTTTLPCLILDDPHDAVHAKPNTVCSQKIFESDLTEIRFNACGYRSSLRCIPPPADTFRIVLLGSSLAEGMWVPVQQSFAAELPEELSQRTGRTVDLYNEGMQWGTARSVDLRIGDILAVKPAIALWTVTPFDIENVNLRVPYIPGKQEQDDSVPGAPAAARVHPPVPHSAWQKLKAAYRKYGSLDATLQAEWTKTINPLNDTRTVFLLKHELYKSQSQFLKQYAMEGDAAGFLDKQMPALWQQHLGDFDTYMADISVQLKAAGVPLVVTVLPHRSQADMISMGDWPAGQDPYLLSNEVRKIAEKHGATYFDILHDYRDIPNPDRLFFPVDGHMNAAGHLVVSHMLANELTSGVVPQLQAARANSTPGAP